MVSPESRKMNVVSHEFAHRLDFEDGTANGAPVLDRSADYDSWSRILGREFEILKKRTEAAKGTLLDGYGATDPGEFFAVATEAFFEMPEKLRRMHPDLYRELTKFYAVDPASWRDARRNGGRTPDRESQGTPDKTTDAAE